MLLLSVQERVGTLLCVGEAVWLSMTLRLGVRDLDPVVEKLGGEDVTAGVRVPEHETDVDPQPESERVRVRVGGVGEKVRESDGPV